MKKEIKFNLNENVMVKLTDVGREELKRQHDKLNAFYPKMPDYTPKKEVDGWSKWQLWLLFSELGHLVNMGSQLPFEAEIKFTVDE